ncbi:hypothetical protein [Streptomyces sp. KR80]|uniref:hypothetical protein n=1 Tax=Streptomyces sp. KR80 TaxID=3457426 RepID=UPI003FD1C5BA
MRFSTITGVITAGALALPVASLASVPAHAAASAAARAKAAQVSPTAPDGALGAQGGCSWFGCSEIQNLSRRNVRVARDWCGSGRNGAISNRSRGPQTCSRNKYKWLKPGQHSYTSAFKDTDSFRVGRGCKMKVQWNTDGQENGRFKTYRPSRTIWVKVSDNYDIDIESYRC